MHNFIFRRIIKFRRNYWFWPSLMTFGAVVLGFGLPYLDSWAGSDWIRAAGFIQATEVAGARAILTTLAGATLGLAGVAFSAAIVAVSFATSNYGPRLIGNFMGDKTNQIVLGIFVATFVYCVAVLSMVHAPPDLSETEMEDFVPQISVLFALLLSLAAVAALITYIHHIPESINIMNLMAMIGDKLERSIVIMLDQADGLARKDQDAVDVRAWSREPSGEDDFIIRTESAGFLQHFDIESLTKLAVKKNIKIILHRTPGDFLVSDEIIMSSNPHNNVDNMALKRMHDCYTMGANRTDIQDVIFLVDQLGEVLGRALSPGVNDPDTAILCLNWLRGGLVVFARRVPVQQPKSDNIVLYGRLTFEEMLSRSFDRTRQYIASDVTATLHALDVLRDIALAARCPAMADACVQQLRRLAISAREILSDSASHKDIEARLQRALQALASRES